MGRTPMFELWTIENALDANKKSSDHNLFFAFRDLSHYRPFWLAPCLSNTTQPPPHIFYLYPPIDLPPLPIIITFTINPNHHLHILFENRFFLPCRCYYYCLEYCQPFARSLKRPSQLLPAPPLSPSPAGSLSFRQIKPQPHTKAVKSDRHTIIVTPFPPLENHFSDTSSTAL